MQAVLSPNKRSCLSRVSVLTTRSECERESDVGGVQTSCRNATRLNAYLALSQNRTASKLALRSNDNNCDAFSAIHPHQPSTTAIDLFGSRKHVTTTTLRSQEPSLEIPRLTWSREAFNDIYLNLSRKPGATRFSESGFGWKPANGETYTCDQAQIIQAQWSRAARGYEIKILSRNDGVIQLDGFKLEVREDLRDARTILLRVIRTSTAQRSSSRSGTASTWTTENMPCVAGIGAKPNLGRLSSPSTLQTVPHSKSPTPKYRTPT